MTTNAAIAFVLFSLVLFVTALVTVLIPRQIMRELISRSRALRGFINGLVWAAWILGAGCLGQRIAQAWDIVLREF